MDKCDKCGELAWDCECAAREIGRELLNIIKNEFLINHDPIFNSKKGEIYRKRKYISKEEAKKIFP